MNKLLFFVFLSHIFGLSVPQSTGYDPNNPYCTSFSESGCTTCGPAGTSDYVFYDSMCTAWNQGDEVSNGMLIRKCDPNCQSCSNGLCNSCKTVLSQTFYLNNSINGVGFESCVPSCEYSLYADNQTGSCKSCPSSCSVCKGSNNCLQCSYNLARWPEDMDFTNKTAFNSSMNCDSHQERIKLSTSDPNYNITLYLSPEDGICMNLDQCDGSFENPYNDINQVLQHLVEETKIGLYAKLQLQIYLLKDNTNEAHFWLEDSSLSTYYSRIFEGTLIDALIQPATCEDTSKCFAENEKAVIYLKSNLISLFVSWKLTIKNIIFDASELIPNGTCYNNNKYTKNRCCQSSGILSKADPNSDAICNLTQAPYLLPIPYLNYDPSVDVWPYGPYSFITMRGIFDNTEYEAPELLIEGCEFKHFWYHRYARSLISLSHYGSIVTIRDTVFLNFQFPHGLITNAHDKIQRDTLFTANVIPKFNCSGCFSLDIEGSIFRNFLPATNYYSLTSNLTGMTLPQNEGIALFLVSFDGPISLLNNTFEKLAGQASFSKVLMNCISEVRTFVGTLFQSLDRMAQIQLGSESKGNVQSASVINIRNLVKGITIYNNTFKNNIASTGTNLLIHNFEDTKIYPIIVEKNNFEANLGLMLGAGFVIMNYARDYVTMDCEGIYIQENIIQNNIGCNLGFGNAMVICIPEKPSISPFVGKSSTPAESELWVQYYPSVNQKINKTSTRATYKDDYSNFTQEVFTKFVNYISQETETPNIIQHPVTNQSIDISHVHVGSNIFYQNSVSFAQLFIQGTFNIYLHSNTFDGNIESYYGSVLQNPIFSRYLAAYNLYTSHSPVLLRLTNYVSIKHNIFTNNSQYSQVSSYVSPAVFGNAITIDRHLGGAPIIVENCTFENHTGLAISGGTNDNGSFKPFNLLPFISYSIWERLQGVNYSDPASSSTLYPAKFGSTVIKIQECVVKGNTGQMFTDWTVTRGNYGLIWQFTDTMRVISPSFIWSSSPMGNIVVNSSIYLQNSTFMSNYILTEITLVNLVTFDYSYIDGNTFINNSVEFPSNGTNTALIQNIPITSSSQLSLAIENNIFESNTGRALYINQSEAVTATSIILSNNSINNHTSVSTIITLGSIANMNMSDTTATNLNANYSVIYLQDSLGSVSIHNTTATNLSTNYSVIYLQGSSGSVSIQDTYVGNVSTTQVGCLYAAGVGGGMLVTNFSCIDTNLTLTQDLISASQISLSPCFLFRDQNSTEIEADGLTCLNSIINSELAGPLSDKAAVANCICLVKMNSINFQDFVCENARALNVNPNYQTSYLVKVNETTQVTITNSIFQDNQPEGPVYMLEGTLNFENITIIRNFPQKALATFLLLENLNLVYLNDVIFQDNSCLDCRGGIIAYYSNIVIENSTFVGNQASEAPIINIKMGTLNITNSSFSNNTALGSSAVLTSDVSTAEISNCVFEKNTAKQSTINTLEGMLVIKASSFLLNEAKSGSKNIYSVETDIYIQDSIFIGSTEQTRTSIRGSFLYLSSGNAQILNTNFTNSFAQIGGAIAFDDAITNTLEIKNCSFINNSATNGGAIYLNGRTSSSAVIENSNFTTNNAVGGAIYADTITTNLTNNIIFSQEASALYFSSGTHILSGLELNGDRSNTLSQAIYANKVNALSLSDSSITGFGLNDIENANQQNISAALAFIADTFVASNYFLKNNTFNNNQGLNGGAIYASGNLTATVTDSIFLNNRAVQGGAIYYQSSSSLSNFTITGNTLFQGNEAIKSGGALQYTDMKINITDTSVTFADNTAVYGPNRAAYGVSIVPLSYINNQRALPQNTSQTLIFDSASGATMDPPLFFQLLDEFGVIVATDNSSILDLTVSSQDTTVTPTFRGNIPFTVMNGYFTLDPLQIFGDPGSLVQIQATLSNSESQQIPQNMTASILVQLRSCILGESLTDDHTCNPCSPGFYTLTAGEINSCDVCPQTGICLGSNLMGPLPNYWRYSEVDNKLNECFNEDACLGALLPDASLAENSYCNPTMLINQTFCLSGWCREGYQGNMCAECSPGWAQSSGSLQTCTRCTKNLKYLGLSVLLVLLFVGYIVFVIRNILNEEQRQKNTQTLLETSHILKKPVLTIELAPSSPPKKDKQFTLERIDSTSKKAADISDSESQHELRLRSNSLMINNSLSNIKLIQTPPKKQSFDFANESLSSSREILFPNQKRRPRLSTFHVPDTLKSVMDKSQVSQPSETSSTRRPKTSVYTKILTNYFHLITIIGRFNFEWPAPVQKLYGVSTAVTKTSSEVFSFDCILKQSFIADFGFRTFYTKLLLISLSPIAIIILVIIIWCIIYLIKHGINNIKKLKSKLGSNIIMSIVVILFILHPSIVEISIESFQCSTLGDDASTSSYMTNDPQLVCFGEEHRKLAFSLGIPCLVFWGIGIPFFAWLVIFRYRKRLDTPTVFARYGFLYKGYKTNVYYWEFVIFYRKVLIILIAIFMANYSVDFQALVVLAVSAGFYLLQNRVQPYETPILNEMEKRSLIVSTVTLYCGVFYLTNQLSAGEKMLPFIILILVNCYYLLYWIVEFLKAQSLELLENKFCAKYFGKILQKITTFEWKPSRKSSGSSGGNSSLLALQPVEEAENQQNNMAKEYKDSGKDDFNADGNQNPSPPSRFLEDPSDITIGESDYSTNRIRKASTLHNMFLMPTPVSSERMFKLDSASNSFAQRKFENSCEPMEESPDVTFGESDVTAVKKVRKSISLHNLFLDPNLLNSKQIDNVGSVFSSRVNSMNDLKKFEDDD